MVENPSPTEHRAEAATVHVKEKAGHINAIRETRIDSRDGYSRHSVDLENIQRNFLRCRRNVVWEGEACTVAAYGWTASHG